MPRNINPWKRKKQTMVFKIFSDKKADHLPIYFTFDELY